MMWRRRKTARRDSGAADPIMLIVSMVVTLTLSAVVAAALIQVVDLGSRVAEEQLTSATLSSAATQFSRDAEAATAVSVSAAAERIRFERATGDTCRVSEWSVAGETLANIAGTGADCGAAELSPVLSVEGFHGSVVARNAAGRELAFTAAGVETGAVTAEPAGRTAAEWAARAPRALALTGEVDLPVAGLRDHTIRGRVFAGDSGAGSLPSVDELAPRADVFTPTAPVITGMVRGSTGVAYAGARESLAVTWTTAQCGPYSPRYTVTWTPSSGTPITKVTEERRVELAPVPNGSRGSVTVSAECPSTVPTTGATVSAAESYVQPLPRPVVAVTGLSAEVHRVSWAPVSSAPVIYVAEMRQGGGSWSTIWNSGPVSDAPTYVRAVPSTVGPGSAYGRATDYRVTASVAPDSAASDPASYTAPWPAISSPAVWTDPWGGAVVTSNRLLWGPNTGCPVGTSAQYLASVSGIGTWGWTAVTSQEINPWWGTRYAGAVQQRCSSAWAASPASPVGSTAWVTAMPQAAAPSISISGGSQAPAALTVHVSSTFCSSNGWLTGWLVNGIWRATTAGSSYALAFYGQPAGTRSFTAQIACQAPATGAAGAYSGAATASRYISAPPPPAAGMPGSNQIAYNIGTNRGCGWPGGTPGVGVGMRINAYAGSCYWQQQHPERDRFGNLTGNKLPWSPAAPGQHYAGAFRG